MKRFKGGDGILIRKKNKHKKVIKICKLRNCLTSEEAYHNIKTMFLFRYFIIRELGLIYDLIYDIKFLLMSIVCISYIHCINI